jgi:sugar lactone lactonase YvrE
VLRDLVHIFDAVGSRNGRTIFRAQPIIWRLWSRKRFIKGVRVLLALITTSVVAAIFAHPWLEAEEALEEPTLLADDSFEMAVFGSYYQPDLRDSNMRMKALLNDLQGPDGLALDPLSGSIFISEEDRAVIQRYDLDGFRQTLVDRDTPVFERKGKQVVRAPGLRSPEGLAFDPAGRLYVVEDIPGGRLIAFDLPEYHHGGPVFGEVVPIPAPAPGYAWESIDVSTSGALLLAGSNLEGFLAARTIAETYSGAILYRDPDGTWWMPIFRELDGFSGACFDVRAENAYFISEVMGYAGCFDLQSHVFKAWYADATIESPEGITAMPDGAAVVVAEGGKLFRIDPQDNVAKEVFDLHENIESVIWDGANSRLLITSDGKGRLIAMDDVFFSSTQKIQGPVLIGETLHEVEIPADCPDYLAGLLKMCRLDLLSSTPGQSFQDLVKNVALFAIDATARPVRFKDDPLPDDPVERVQFAIFTPHFFGVDLSGLSGPASGLVAVHKSGKMTHTILHRGSMTHISLADGRFGAFNKSKIALPYPFSYRLTPDGLASVSFMGLGQTPDYHIVINLKHPTHSYMVAMHPDGSSQQYKLNLPADRDVMHWIVGLKREAPDSWARVDI